MDSVYALVHFIAPDAGGAPLRAAFSQPLAVLAAHAPAEVRGVLDAVQAQAGAGRWCVGFVRYEAAPAFDAALQVHAPQPGPLAWFGVFDAPCAWPENGEGSARIDWREALDADAARAAITESHRRITAGEVYQINHTARMHGQLQGSPRALFAALQRAQPGTHAALIDTGAQQVLSVSPELFFDWRPEAHAGGRILAAR